jgi:endonuclease/exonuclease/phosphatase family metal-dependent hydrolase
MSLTLVTYNVWFGEYFRAERRRALVAILRECDADIIALQEVTPSLLRVLQAQAWLRERYRFADVSVDPYGVLMLTRVPVRRFAVHALPTRMGRSLLVAELDRDDGLAVATVHLESLHYADTRQRQLARIFPVLAAYPHAVLMGDFNLCSSWPENRHLDPRYTDIWPHLRPHEPGWTEDTDLNTMRLLVNNKRTQVRFDRIILRSTGDRWRPRAIDRLGTEPIEVAPDRAYGDRARGDRAPGHRTVAVFPSDHFGLCATIVRGEAP